MNFRPKLPIKIGLFTIEFRKRNALFYRNFHCKSSILFIVDILYFKLKVSRASVIQFINVSIGVWWLIYFYIYIHKYSIVCVSIVKNFIYLIFIQTIFLTSNITTLFDKIQSNNIVIKYKNKFTRNIITQVSITPTVENSLSSIRVLKFSKELLIKRMFT